MALADSKVQPEGPKARKRESLTSALIQIGVVGLLLAAVVFAVYRHGHQKTESARVINEARALALRGNPADIQKALTALEPVMDDNGEAYALAADLQTELWLTHQVPGADVKARELLEKAERKDVKSEERYGNRALHLIADGKPKDAETFIEDLRKQGASTPKLWYAQGRALQEQGNLVLARQAFSQAINKAWREPRYAASFGEALIDEGQYGMALEYLSKGLTANADHLRTRLDVALAQLLKRELSKNATDTLQEVSGRDAELTPGLKARALSAKAQLALLEQKPDEAIKLADESIAINPSEHYALFTRARALASKKDASALDAFKAAIAKRKSASGLYLDGALTLAQNGDAPGAVELLNSYEATFKDIQLTATDGSTTSAIEKDDRYWIARGDVLKASGDADQALKAYEKAIAAESVNLNRAQYAKGALFLEQKKLDEAAQTLMPIAPADGSGLLPEAYVALGETLFAKKDFANGCQQYAFALTRMRAQSTPREKLAGIVDSVKGKLTANGKSEMAQLWVKETQSLIQ